MHAGVVGRVRIRISVVVRDRARMIPEKFTLHALKTFGWRRPTCRARRARDRSCFRLKIMVDRCCEQLKDYDVHL